MALFESKSHIQFIANPKLTEPDWLALGTAFGLAAYAPATEKELEEVMAQTADYQGPALIAAKINPQSYWPTIRALRG